MTRCVLLQSGLHASFWGEPINTANYIRNRCPSSSLGGKTAYELWTGKVPNVSYFKEFGCEVYTLDREPAKSKLNDRSKKGIFLGYSDNSKVYRVWLVNERKIDVTRDVKFLQCPENFLPENEYELVDHMYTDNHEEETIEFYSQPTGTPNQEDDQTEEDTPSEDTLEESRRGSGRPRKVKTGLRGRPKKMYQQAKNVDSPTETNVNVDTYPELASHVEISPEEALQGSDANQWYQAIASEMKCIIQNGTWKIVDRPKDQQVIGSRIVLRNKFRQDGTLEHRKARKVAKGFAQRFGVDFNETFSPVARLGTVRMEIALATEQGWVVNHFDVTTAYLNGEIEEKIFMEVPEYTEESLKIIIRDETPDSRTGKIAFNMLNDIKKGNKVCLLNKALYGLRQAGRCWNIKLNKRLGGFGARQSSADPCLYFRGQGDDLLIAVYVDDIIVASKDRKKIDELELHLAKSFDLKNLGEL